jgi:hypothetical protein
MYQIKIRETEKNKNNRKRKRGLTNEKKGWYRNKNKHRLKKARNNDTDIKRKKYQRKRATLI